MVKLNLKHLDLGALNYLKSKIKDLEAEDFEE
jgi:hypothetical protein